MNDSHTLFISDLHLCPEQPDTAMLFQHFLTHEAYGADALYILGDFFEVWIGDDDKTPFNDSIIKSLREYTLTGVPTYFMPGNRDFLIGKRFAKATGITLLPDPTLIELYDIPTLLMHGDSLCTQDTRHQKTRKIMHNRFYQWLSQRLPLRIRRHYAQRFRQISQRHLQNPIIDVCQEEVLRVLSETEAQRLIHGHTHRPAIHSLNSQQPPVERIVLGAWHHQGSYLQIDAMGNRTLITYPALGEVR